MKIRHVVTYAGSDGAYGGPLTVAVNQVRALRSMGHDAVVWSAADPRAARVDPCIRTFPYLHVVKSLGFPSMVSVDLLKHVWSESASVDALHVHAAREAIPTLATLIGHRSPRVVLQTHGNYIDNNRLKARVFDKLLTRPAFEAADVMLLLQQREYDDMRDLMLSLGMSQHPTMDVVPNGVPTSSLRAIPPTHAANPNIVFLARLHERKQPHLFIDVAEAMLVKHPSLTFSILGPDGGELESVQKRLAARGDSRISYEGQVPTDEVASRLARASLLILPSRADTFPMSVLEAMAVGLPCVVGRCIGFADALAQRDSAVLSHLDVAELASAALSALGAPRWDDLSQNALKHIDAEFSSEAIATRLLTHYQTGRSGEQR